MKIALLGTILIIIVVVIVGGLAFFRSTSPEADVTDPDLILEEEKIPSSNSGTNSNQFLMVEPDGALPPVSEKELSAFDSPSPTEIADSESSSSATTVTIDDTGFTPATLTVTAGTTVTFLNNGQAPHWPASDNHPAHDLLPGFDAQAGIQTGDEYSFTFTEPGTWTYHDHLITSLTGTIIVEEAE